MRSDDSAVTMARVTHTAGAPAIAAVRWWVEQFARRYGMRETADLNVVVSEAMTDAVRRASPIDATGEVVVDAATDGEWLTVRVADSGGGEGAGAGPGLQRTARLAGRVEVAAGDGDVGTVVLMEFPMRPRATRRRPMRRARRVRGADCR